jgi:SPP1 gp7 family putative phage head morphogenesis protein
VATANSDYFDAQLRHAIGVRRFTAGEVKRILALIEKGDRSLASDLLDKLGGFRSPPDFKSERWLNLLRSVRDARQELILNARNETADSLIDYAKHEAEFESSTLQLVIPVSIDLASVSVEQLREIVYRRPFQGHLLNDWYKQIALKDRGEITRQLQLGMAQGESIPDIVKRVAGTAANSFEDGALGGTRRGVEAVVRTAVNHVSNATREQIWEDNADIIAYKRWTATLDRRTSAICRANDGKGIPVGDKPLPDGVDPVVPEGITPPAHINCRSVLVAVLDGEGVLGNRPFVATESGEKVTPEDIGQVPASTTYSDWLKTQSASFQDDVLGHSRGLAFRKGEYALDEYVDRKGNELTLSQLKLA